MITIESIGVGTFYIRNIESCEQPLTLVSGYIALLSNGLTVGFHFNYNGKCTITDLNSGTYICKTYDFYECLDWVDKEQELISRKLSQDIYQQRKQEFEELLNREEFCL